MRSKDPWRELEHRYIDKSTSSTVTQAIWVVGALGGLALAAVTLYLIILNWNQQLGATLLSVMLGGTVTLFIAVFAQLKESTVSGQFLVDIPFDSSTGFPVWSLESPPKDERALRRSIWLSALYRIAVQPHSPPVAPGESVTFDLRSVARPVSPDEMFIRCSQMVQYKLLEDLRDNQSGSHLPIVDGHEIPSFFAPAPVGSTVDYPPDKLQQLLKSNQFHSPSAFLWKHRTLRVPPHSRLFLRHVPSSQITGVTKDLIVVERPNYFRAVITIEPLGAGSVGQSTIRSVRVGVSMKATIFKLAAGSAYSTQVMDWCAWLFKMFEAANVA